MEEPSIVMWWYLAQIKDCDTTYFIPLKNGLVDVVSCDSFKVETCPKVQEGPPTTWMLLASTLFEASLLALSLHVLDGWWYQIFNCSDWKDKDDLLELKLVIEYKCCKESD
jgi:hypothetical protein